MKDRRKLKNIVDGLLLLLLL